MKKVLSTVLATAMALGMSATAFAAPIYETGETLKNTVIGFSGAEKTYNLDVTQVGGTVNVPFNLGENASYYNVEIDITEGGKQLDAEYSKTKNAIVIRPTVNVKLTEAENYQIEIEVLDRKNKETVAEGYVISGEVSYDQIQYVDSGSRYNNARGCLYDFSNGTDNVEIYAGNDVSVNITKSLRGVHNFHMSTDAIDALDEKFEDSDLDVFSFVARPKFSNAVSVTFDIAEGSYVYEYADGKLFKPADLSYDENEGYVIKTKQLGTYVVSDEQLTEGVVEENNGASSDEKPQTTPDKNNPTTGASDLFGAAVAMAVLSLTGAGVFAAKRFSK